MADNKRLLVLFSAFGWIRIPTREHISTITENPVAGFMVRRSGRVDSSVSRRNQRQERRHFQSNGLRFWSGKVAMAKTYMHGDLAVKLLTE